MPDLVAHRDTSPATISRKTDRQACPGPSGGDTLCHARSWMGAIETVAKGMWLCRSGAGCSDRIRAHDAPAGSAFPIRIFGERAICFPGSGLARIAVTDAWLRD